MKNLDFEFLSFSLASWLLCCFFHLRQPLFMFSCLIIEIGNIIDYTYFRSRMSYGVRIGMITEKEKAEQRDYLQKCISEVG